MQSTWTSSVNAQYGKLGSKEHFRDRAIDALSVIKISNSFLQSTVGQNNQDPKALAAFHNIEKAVMKVEAFLDCTKNVPKQIPSMNSHHTKIKKKVFSLSELLQMSIPKNCPTGVKINLPKNDFKLEGDFYKLVVVLANLIENSIDAMKNNGVINILSRESDGFVVFEVKDSGPGIPDEIINKVFSSLYTTKTHGSGLGLKMAKTIIESHGGSISIRNNPTTFTIKLPKS
jgi:signal transduction histidine kinase